MAIQPQFARAILSGAKQVEFRKRRLAEDIDTVLIYETAPTQRIVGRFTIASTVETTPQALWRRFGPLGGIGRSDFMDYYTGHQRAVGLVVKDIHEYSRAIALSELSCYPPVPQSFAYLPSSTLDEIECLQPTADLIPILNLSRLRQAPGRLLAGVASR